MFNEQPPRHMPESSRKTRAFMDKAYSYFFGLSSKRQVGWRLSVDVTLANAALFFGVATRAIYVGQITTATSFASAFGQVLGAYGSLLITFNLLAVTLLAGSRIYRPLPSGRLLKRLTLTATACGLGMLTQLGFAVLIGNAPARGTAVVTWLTLLSLLIGTRLIRTFIRTHFSVVPRKAQATGRVEDVLVVGGAGYIGSVLTRQLLTAGYRVRILDLQLFGGSPIEELKDHSRLEIMQGDFRNVEDVVRSLRGMDAVIHLAAIVGDPACAVDQDTTIGVNYGAAKMIAELAKANGISRFLFASTCSVYGASDDIIDESAALNPVSLYATTKVDAERALLETADDVFQPTILRLATAYGWSHRPRFDLVANLISARAVTHGEFSIFNGEQWRPFINTRDISRAFVMVLESPLERVGGEIFNVGDNDQNYTLKQLGEIVADVAPAAKMLEVRNDEDPRNYRVRFDKIRNAIGYRAAVTLEEGVREIIEAVQAGRVTDWTDPIYSNLKQMEGDNSLKVVKEDGQVDEGLETTNKFLRRAA